jgi:hypothetical protein
VPAGDRRLLCVVAHLYALRHGKKCIDTATIPTPSVVGDKYRGQRFGDLVDVCASRSNGIFVVG